jgi:hypothetical protein
VLDHLHDADLLLDLQAHVLLLDLVLVEHFDGVLALVLRVQRELDLAERALSERLADLILADLLRHRAAAGG